MIRNSHLSIAILNMATYMRSRLCAWQCRLRSFLYLYNGERSFPRSFVNFNRFVIKPPDKFDSGSFSVKQHMLLCWGVSSALLVQAGTFSKKENDEEESPVIMALKMAKLAQMKQEPDKAVAFLHTALEAAEKEYKNQRMSKRDYIYARINVYDSLANLALSKGEFTTAEKLFKESMKGCLEVGIEKTDNAIIEMSMKLASIYAMQKRDDEAVQGYEFCVETQTKKVEEDPECGVDTQALLGMVLEAYGRYLLYHKYFDQSLVMLTRAVDIAKKTLGESGTQTLVLMNDLATVYILKKDFEQAQRILKQAIDIGGQVESTHCPALYCNLGAVYMHMAQLSDTEAVCKHGLKLAKKYKDKLAMEQANICLKKVKEMKKRGF